MTKRMLEPGDCEKPKFFDEGSRVGEPGQEKIGVLMSERDPIRGFGDEPWFVAETGSPFQNFY
jgi:hypothetical protein